jgi:hypothetical protein
MNHHHHHTVFPNKFTMALLGIYPCSTLLKFTMNIKGQETTVREKLCLARGKCLIIINNNLFVNV